MATSVNFTTSVPNIVYFIVATENNYNVANNTSNVTVSVWAKHTVEGMAVTAGGGTCYCSIDGTEYTANITSTQTITGVPRCVFSRTFDILHNNDGTRGFSTYAHIYHQHFTSTSQGFGVVLTTITRASSISGFDNFVIGDNVFITLTGTNTSFLHTLVLKIGGTVITTRTGVGLNGSMILTGEECTILYNALQNSASGTVTLYCSTFNGSTQIGSTTTATAIATVAPNNVPYFDSFVATGMDETTGYFIKNLTPVTLTISGAVGTCGSTITGYNINFYGSDYRSATAITPIINSSGDFIATATVTDSRGRKYSQTLSITIQDPMNIVIKDPSVIPVDPTTIIPTDDGSGSGYISIPADTGYLIGDVTVLTDNITPKTYTGMQFNGKSILDNICVRNYVQTVASPLLVSKPTWTDDVLFQVVFNNTSTSTNVFGLLEPQTKWNLSRQEVGSDIIETVGSFTSDVESYIDYKVESNRNVCYFISAQNDSQLSNPIQTDPIMTIFYGVYLLDATSIDEGINNDNIECYKFDISCTVQSISNNADITTYRNYTKYDSYFTSDVDYLSGSITSLLYYVDENNDLQWSVDYLNKFRAFINNKQEKILKFKNGQAIRCVTFNSNTESFSYQTSDAVVDSRLLQPTTVTFGFRETEKV